MDEASLLVNSALVLGIESPGQSRLVPGVPHLLGIHMIPRAEVYQDRRDRRSRMMVFSLAHKRAPCHTLEVWMVTFVVDLHLQVVIFGLAGLDRS